jgi:hypothetical protein
MIEDMGTQRMALGALVCCLVAACGSTRTKSWEPDFDIEHMERLDSKTFHSVWALPDLDLTRYHRVLIDPVTTDYRRNYEIRKVPKAEVEECQRQFRLRLMAEFRKGGYEVVEEPGPDVLRFTARITELEAGKSAAFVTTSTAWTAMETGLFDSVSGEILVAVADKLEGPGVAAALFKWSEAYTAFEFWAEAFRKHLDHIHGKLEESDLPGRPDPRRQPEPEPEEVETGSSA